MKPTKIKQVLPAELLIQWDDGHKGIHVLPTLRKYCPCASCKTDMEAHEGIISLPVLKPGQYELKSIEPIGSYALQLTWGDGHKTGIYTFDYLRQICECESCRQMAEE